MEKDDTSRGAARTQKTQVCSEQSYESACLCWLWGKQGETNHLKTLSTFVSDLLSQGKAENHVVEERNKPWPPQVRNFSQQGPNTPVWKRERAYYNFCDQFGGCWGWVSEITWPWGLVTSRKHCVCQSIVIAIGMFSHVEHSREHLL